MRIDLCRVLGFPKVTDTRGNLSFIESHNHVPFDIKRVYYLYDVPSGAERAGHAHRELEQVYIAMSGSCDVTLDDGSTRQVFHLNRPHYGLYIAPMIWRDISNFSGSCVVLALASEPFAEADYIRDYDAYAKERHGT